MKVHVNTLHIKPYKDVTNFHPESVVEIGNYSHIFHHLFSRQAALKNLYLP